MRKRLIFKLGTAALYGAKFMGAGNLTSPGCNMVNLVTLLNEVRGNVIIVIIIALS